MLIGYGRVSTAEQKTELQFDALTAAGCEKLFIEKASSAHLERPQLELALAFARAGDTLVVWKLDRIARSLRQLIDTFDTLNSNAVGLRSLTEAVDTETPGGKLIFHIFGALAEFERSLIRERTNAGLLAARARGKIGGRPKALTGEDIISAKALLRDGNLSVVAIARRLGVTPSTLYRYLPAARSCAKQENIPTEF
ncbi:recombinase family protein [Methylobacterium goesingense]|uniref:DNA invertase Pin-like site-specific DNA recombinase n=1 Tax=Methylobacterium goesingense TaxID=243690 RepID=A0ABV2L6M4_9HYPH|nr:recombinase family protein [Methylobacterium goesingense]